MTINIAPYVFAAIFLAMLLLLLAVSRRPYATVLERKVCGVLAAAVIFLALTPRAVAGVHAARRHDHLLPCVGVGLAAIAIRFARFDLE